MVVVVDLIILLSIIIFKQIMHVLASRFSQYYYKVMTLISNHFGCLSTSE